MFMEDLHLLLPGYEPDVPQPGPTDNQIIAGGIFEKQDAVLITYQVIAKRIIAGCVFF